MMRSRHLSRRKEYGSLVAAAAFLLAARCTDAGQIHAAAKADDAAGIQACIERDGSNTVRTTIGNGVTPLHIAAAFNRVNAADVLIKAGAEIQATTADGFTPLHWAAGRDAVDTVQALIAAGASIEATARNGITPLHWAASRNATNTVRLLLAAGASITATTAAGLKPLHMAVMRGSDDVAVMLAFKTVMDEPEAATPSPEPGTQAEDEPPRPKPMHVSRSATVPGSDLIIPVSGAQDLVFAWREKPGLWFCRYELTNAQYRRFKPGHSSYFNEGFTLDGRDQPVVYVTWHDANAFCAWLNTEYAEFLPAGFVFRLPTEAEWMAAARCGDERPYPWGANWPPEQGNFADRAALRQLPDTSGISEYDDGAPVTCPVAQAGANAWGIHGMAGNVWEWCSDSYEPQQKYRVRKGASWNTSRQPLLTVDYRGYDAPDTRDESIGVRLVVARRTE